MPFGSGPVCMATPDCSAGTREYDPEAPDLRSECCKPVILGSRGSGPRVALTVQGGQRRADVGRAHKKEPGEQRHGPGIAASAVRCLAPAPLRCFVPTRCGRAWACGRPPRRRFRTATGPDRHGRPRHRADPLSMSACGMDVVERSDFGGDVVRRRVFESRGRGSAPGHWREETLRRRGDCGRDVPRGGAHQDAGRRRGEVS